MRNASLLIDVLRRNQDGTPTPQEVDSVASLLEGAHGTFAADVADFLATKHSLDGDAGRSWAWNGVAQRIRERARQRSGNAPRP